MARQRNRTAQVMQHVIQLARDERFRWAEVTTARLVEDPRIAGHIVAPRIDVVLDRFRDQPLQELGVFALRPEKPRLGRPIARLV